MAYSLYDFLKKDVQKMIDVLSDHDRGNLYPLVIQEVERHLIKLVLEETDHNFLKAARVLGISRSTLYRKIDTLRIPTKHTQESLSEER